MLERRAWRGAGASDSFPLPHTVLVAALPALVVPHLPLLSAARPSGLGFSLGVRTHLGLKAQRPHSDSRGCVASG